MSMTFKIMLALFCFAAPFATYATDSSSIKLPAPSSLVVNYPEVTSLPPAVKNERYDLLPACLSPPTNCPDINGKGGSLATCPDVCTVTRSPSTLTTNPFAAITDTSCPPSYVMTGVYNMQNEGSYNPNPPVAPWPIPGMATYNNYKSLGYDCNLPLMPMGGKLSDQYCAEVNGGDYTVGQIIDTLNGAMGSVVKVTSTQTINGTCYAFPFCSSIAPCSVFGAYPYRQAIYGYVLCKPPGGVYLTSNLAPVSVVCTRTKTKWTPLQ